MRRETKEYSPDSACHVIVTGGPSVGGGLSDVLLLLSLRIPPGPEDDEGEAELQSGGLNLMGWDTARLWLKS